MIGVHMLGWETLCGHMWGAELKKGAGLGCGAGVRGGCVGPVCRVTSKSLALTMSAFACALMLRWFKASRCCPTW